MKDAGVIETGSPYKHDMTAVASFTLMIVGDDGTKIVAEQGVQVVIVDGAIHVMDEKPLFYLPVDLPAMTPGHFSRALQNQRDRFLAKVLEEDIEDINARFLRNAYREEARIGNGIGCSSLQGYM